MTRCFMQRREMSPRHERRLKDFLPVSSACVFVLCCPPVSMAGCTFDVFLLLFPLLRLHQCLMSQDSETPDITRVLGCRLSSSCSIMMVYSIFTPPSFCCRSPSVSSLPRVSTSLYNPFVIVPLVPFFFTCQTQSVCEPLVFAYLLSGGSKNSSVSVLYVRVCVGEGMGRRPKGGE